MPAEEIAVALRDADHAAPLVLRVFAEAGVPVALERSVPVAHTTLGRGLLALLGAALPGGTRRGPARLAARPGPPRPPREGRSASERDLRRGGARDAGEAHDAWERLAGFRFGELDDLAALAGDPVAFCDLLLVRAEELLVAPVARERRRPAAGERRGRSGAAARAHGARAAHPAGARRHDAGARPAEPRRAAGRRARHRRVRARTGPRDDRRPAAPARTARARCCCSAACRRASSRCPAGGDPFLGDAERLRDQRRRRPAPAPARGPPGRRALAPLLGRLAADRAAGPRPGTAATTTGEPRVRSLFVDDVLACFEPSLAARAIDRRLGEVGFPQAGGRPAPAAARRRGRRTRAGARARPRPADATRRRSPRSARVTRGRPARSSSGPRAPCGGSSSGCCSPSSSTRARRR